MAKNLGRPAPEVLPIRAPKPITLGEVKFANAYLETGNATEAARRAGIKSTNDDALGARARKILGKVRVLEYLRRARHEALDAETVTPRRSPKGWPVPPVPIGWGGLSPT